MANSTASGPNGYSSRSSANKLDAVGPLCGLCQTGAILLSSLAMLKKFLVFSACFALVGGVALAARSNNQGDKIPEYTPVPNWLQLPKGFKFGLATAVATDKDDNLFIFHRGKRPIIVFDKTGKFLRSWG